MHAMVRLHRAQTFKLSIKLDVLYILGPDYWERKHRFRRAKGTEWTRKLMKSELERSSTIENVYEIRIDNV